MKKTNKQEGTFAIMAALIVLFSAMLDPLISVTLSIIALAGFALWKFMKE